MAFRSPLAPRAPVELLASLHWPALLLAALLGAAGVAALYSVAGGSMEPHAMAHLTRLVMGFALVLAMAMLPLRVWMWLSYPAYGFLLAALALVPLLGIETSGAQRWLALGPISFQPAEPMKVALVLALARYFQAVEPGGQSRPRHVAAALALIAAPVLLILDQPDLGTALLVAAIGLSVMFAAGVNLWWFAAGLALASVAAPLLWARLHGYQQERILVFLDPEADPLGKGYQIAQSKIALGAGGLLGRGFLQGTQSQLDFVPEAHTDFIFALIAEETGFWGSLALMALFLALVLLLLLMGIRCSSVFGRLVCLGAAVLLGLHVLVNIAMVAGALPVVGVPLPLVSYGGTSLFAMLVALGLAVNAHVHRRERLQAGDAGFTS